MFVPPAARTVATADSERRQVRAELARLDRKAPPRVVVLPFAEVGPEPVESWPTGRLWLDTGTLGPDGAHPLNVRRGDGSWDQVGWMVPVEA